MVATLIYAGLRREELLWLTHDDIDLKTAATAMSRVRTETIAGQSWQPKTARNRAVPITSRLPSTGSGRRSSPKYSTLRRYLDRYTRRIVPGGWLFPSPASTW